MKNSFPKYNRAVSTGERGVNLVSTIVNDKLKWIFRRTHNEHDFGIDGYIDLVTNDRLVTGKTLAVQIKSGESFFRQKDEYGFIYYGEIKHLNYFINHPVPIIIILCDLDTFECYWVKFNPNDTESTPSGWKITVPYENILSNSHDKLERLAGPAKDYTDELRAFWSTNNLIEESGHILYLIDPIDIENFDFTNILNFFERLSVNKKVALKSQGKVEIGVFGYDDDPRELFEIRKVKQFISELDYRFDSAFYFLRNEPKAQGLKLLACCSCDAKWVGRRATKDRRGQVEFDPDKFGNFFARHFLGLNRMTEWLKLSLDENKRISFAVTKYFGYYDSEEEHV